MTDSARVALVLAVALAAATAPPGAADADREPTTEEQEWTRVTDHLQPGPRSALRTAREAIDVHRANPHVEALDLGGTVQVTDRLLAATPPAVLGDRSQPSDTATAPPSILVGELLDRHDRELTPRQEAQTRALDRLDPEPRRALATVLEAFLAFEDAGQAYVAASDGAPAGVSLAEAHAALEALPAEELDAATATERLQEAGIEPTQIPLPQLEQVLEVRNRLLAASLALDDALEANPSAPSLAQDLDLCPTLAISLSNEGTTYEQDCRLIIDAGGPDRYENNAGGTNMVDRKAACNSFDIPQDNNATALVDLGGHDRYGDPADPTDCGSNGGGWAGVGFLLDVRGDDTYVAGNGAGNGGGFDGVGTLVDLHGDDRYRGEQSVNAASFIGAGSLYDASGDDRYVSEDIVANGAGLLGAAALVDASGSDRYVANESTVNGAGGLGSGAIVDGAGDDVYSGEGRANGGATLGTGTLVDGAGDDTYQAGPPPSNGGAELAGAVLVDGEGLDRYREVPDRRGTDKTILPKGSLGAQIDLPHDPSEFDHPVEATPAQGEARPHVIVGVGDDGINPYHETFYRPSLTSHPCTYVEGFPCSVPSLDLTLPADPDTSVETVDEAYERDSDEWNKTRPGEVFWIPKTPFVAVTCAGVAGPGCAFDTDHGVKTTSNVLAENPDALLGFVAADGDIEPLEAYDIPVDLYSVSFGNLVPIPMPGGPCPLADDAPLYVTSAGNDPYTTVASCWKGNPRVVSVGGAYAADDTEEAQATKQTDVVSYYCRPVAVPDAVSGTQVDCGTSFGTPTVAGALSRVVLELRRDTSYLGSVATDQVAPGVTVHDLRDAMNRTASYDPEPAYDTTAEDSDPGALPGVPLNPAAPWLQWGWGFYDGLVAEDTLEHLRPDGAQHPAKPLGAQAYMTAQHEAKSVLYTQR
jgi:hypothetical protein